MFHATGLPGWARFGARHTKRAPFASDADERELLKRQVEFFEGQLQDAKKRLEELEK
jgi:hypothetical protein